MAGLFPVSVLGELVSMGTLLAFATVCIGVLILRYTRPDLKRSFRVPFVWPICVIGALACVYLFWQAFEEHWRLMVGWIVIGQLIYFGYGYAHSKLRKSSMLEQLLAKKSPQAEPDDAHGPALRRTLGPWGLTALGIGAVIGGGIFVITGVAAAEHAGPAIILSFIIAAICSVFTALCYAEFASLIPVSGSAYSYAYATLGEGAAWFIGWNLILEYGVSASAVAVSWTGYFVSLLDHVGIHIPPALTNAPLDFVDGHLVTTGALFNLPAVGITLALTWLCYVGIRESAGLNMAMVLLKTALIIVVIVVGASHIDTSHWHPFIPENQGGDKYGWPGILRGASMVFFAYIGFEATSTAAQESKNPQRDMPIGTLASLGICTVLYIAMAAVLTGLVPFSELDTAEPVVTAIRNHPELSWLRGIVEVGALIGLSSVGVLPTAGGLDARAMLAQPRKGYILYNVEPPHDFADGALAQQAMHSAQTVVAFAAYASDALKDSADVILPIALTPELDGTLVNVEGTAQVVAAGAKAPGDARQGWKVLRALGGLLGVAGFEFDDLAGLRDGLTERASDVRSQLASRASGVSFSRLATTPIYRGDAVLRRAGALNSHPLNRAAAIR
ncbi:hypothetical protein KCV01_g20956, partial [Aureobasidium melanogenum]